MLKRVTRTVLIVLALIGSAVGLTQIQPAYASAPVASFASCVAQPTALEPWI